MRIASLIQHAKRMRHIVTSFLASFAPPYFSTLSHKEHDFRKKKKRVTEYKILFQAFLIVRRNQRDTVINVKTPACQLPVILVGFYLKLSFVQQIFEGVIGINFYQNPSNGSRYVPCEHTDGPTHGRTDMMSLIVAFRNFANALKKLETQCLLYDERNDFPCII
jgi:hypothetical protein